MIMICERCCAPIADGEALVRFAHIDQALPDGSITWLHTYVHTAVCVVPRSAPHERPDQGEWDRSRGVGGHRAA